MWVCKRYLLFETTHGIVVHHLKIHFRPDQISYIVNFVFYHCRSVNKIISLARFVYKKKNIQIQFTHLLILPQVCKFKLLFF